MNRRIFALLFAVVFALLLTACGAVGKTEEAIDAIGRVDIDSFDDIEYAQDLYDDLSEKQQDRVENADELEEAQEEYNHLLLLIDNAQKALDAVKTVSPDSGSALDDAWAAYAELDDNDLTDQVKGIEKKLDAAQAEFDRQCGLVGDFENAVAAIGTVTLDSEAAIQAAEEAYAVLESESLTGYVTDAELVAARETYQDLTLQKACGEIEDQYNAGAYESAINAVQALYDLYPDHAYSAEMFQLEARCYIALAQKEYNNGKMEASLDYLAQAKNHGSGLSEYTTLKQKVENKIAANRPDNGTKLYSGIGTGYSNLIVKAGNTDVCVKVESVDDPNKYTLFYVHANSEYKLSIATGEYYFKYVTGDTWYSDGEMFGSSGSFSQSNETLDFSLSYYGDYVYYHTITITLQSVSGGNFDTYPITGDSF